MFELVPHLLYVSKNLRIEVCRYMSLAVLVPYLDFNRDVSDKWC